MKLTKSHLRRIIKEEIEKSLDETAIANPGEMRASISPPPLGTGVNPAEVIEKIKKLPSKALAQIMDMIDSMEGMELESPTWKKAGFSSPEEEKQYLSNLGTLGKADYYKSIGNPFGESVDRDKE